MTWANETGIICPTNEAFTHQVTLASGNDPAQWILNGLIPDDSFVAISGNSAKSYSMVFDAGDVFVEDGDATAIKEVAKEDAASKVYTVDGQYVGNSLNGLSKGLYVVNGKKYVVK
jgi:hypothetical protein